MLSSYLTQLWLRGWSALLTDLNAQEIAWLLRPASHISLLANRRATLIASRVRLVAGLFAALTPLWSLLDIWAFAPEVWHGLVAMRLAATVAFVCLVMTTRGISTLRGAYQALTFLLAIPTAFFLISYLHMSQFRLEGLQEAFAVGYAYLPFVMLAGLSIFPLTIAESLAFSAPLLITQVLAAALRLEILNWPNFAASFWLLMLIASVSTLAGLSQLAFMIVLVREAIRDGMTGCFSHKSGAELLDLQYIIATRSGTPLSVAFIDLDHFKQVNDQFGHDAGDQVLINAVNAIRGHLRTGDILIRWGGEEFVLVLPNTNAAQALTALTRVRNAGLGMRPDGKPVTASIGIAERQQDGTEGWRELVEVADTRMYQAKKSGRDRIFSA